MNIATLRRICGALDVGVELQPRGRGSDLDRLVNARHSALHEELAAWFAIAFPEWELAHEVSFNVWGERGVIDLLAWHPGQRALLIIEVKTEIVDQGELLSTMDRRVRLARQIVAPRGWDPMTVSTWVVVARSRTTERQIAAHRTVLRSAFPDEIRGVHAWLAKPSGQIRALSLWHSKSRTVLAPTQRVRRGTP
jgi:hypothetical protein